LGFFDIFLRARQLTGVLHSGGDAQAGEYDSLQHDPSNDNKNENKYLHYNSVLSYDGFRWMSTHFLAGGFSIGLR
jgi:hypothetical protein